MSSHHHRTAPIDLAAFLVPDEVKPGDIRTHFVVIAGAIHNLAIEYRANDEIALIYSVDDPEYGIDTEYMTIPGALFRALREVRS